MILNLTKVLYQKQDTRIVYYRNCKNVNNYVFKEYLKPDLEKFELIKLV